MSEDMTTTKNRWHTRPVSLGTAIVAERQIGDRSLRLAQIVTPYDYQHAPLVIERMQHQLERAAAEIGRAMP